MSDRIYSTARIYLAGATLVLALSLGVGAAFAQEDESATFDGEWRYAESCASCHGDEGEGVSAFGPPLAGNALVMNSPPGPILRVIQEGRYNRNKAYPEFAGMPAFPKLRAAEARALVDYMKNAFDE